MVKIFLHLTHVFFHSTLHMAVDVGLLTALIISIHIIDTSSCSPFVIVGPTVGIVDIALLWIDVI